MSRENRVNPGTYTQAGRLTPDDAARELVKQRQSMSSSHGKGNPKARSEAWLHQAEDARRLAGAPTATEAPSWNTAFVLIAAGAVCLSLYVATRLAAAARRPAPSSVPATNHTPGRPYAYGI